MKWISGFTAALFSVLGSAYAGGSDYGADRCIQLDFSETLAWDEIQNDAGITSEISLINLSRIPPYDRDGILVRGKSESCLKWFSADAASVVDTCRDSESGQIHSVIRKSAGQYSDVQIWSVDPATSELVQEYEEGWVDSYQKSESPLVTPDGQCLWRERQAARMQYDNALKALRVDMEAEEAVELDEVDKLLVRPLAAEMIQHWLMSLAGNATVTIEDAVYASDTDRVDWRVVQLRGNVLCNADGVVLALNRRTGQWHAIYDVKSGCSKSLDFPFYGMHVSEGDLIVSACTECSWWGRYASFAINLETWQVSLLELAPEWGDPHYSENPEIQNVEQVVFGD